MNLWTRGFGFFWCHEQVRKLYKLFLVEFFAKVGIIGKMNNIHQNLFILIVSCKLLLIWSESDQKLGAVAQQGDLYHKSEKIQVWQTEKKFRCTEKKYSANLSMMHHAFHLSYKKSVLLVSLGIGIFVIFHIWVS